MLSELPFCRQISRLCCQRGKHWKNFYSIPYLRENGRNGFPRVHCLRFSSIFWTHLGGTCFSSWTAFLVFLTAASSTFDEGMPCETRDCHMKRNIHYFVWQSLRQSTGIPIRAFPAADKENAQKTSNGRKNIVPPLVLIRLTENRV